MDLLQITLNANTGAVLTTINTDYTAYGACVASFLSHVAFTKNTRIPILLYLVDQDSLIS